MIHEMINPLVLYSQAGDVDNNRMKLEFDHFVSDVFKIQYFNGTWLSDHELVYVDQNGSIAIYDADLNQTTSTLIKTHDKTLHTINEFKLSQDRQSILFITEQRKEFGAIVSARYAIYNISSQSVEHLDDLVKSNNHYYSFMKQPVPLIQYASWGPTSNSIVFIESNDIYLIPDFRNHLIYQQQNLANSMRYQTGNNLNSRYLLRLTKTGSLSNSIKNGLPDGLYRNNIFTKDEATLWWSADGHYLAYLSFDDAEVQPTPIEYYDSYMQESNNNPKIHYESYPRAGAANPRVSVHIVDLSALMTDSLDDMTALEQSAIITPPAELIKQLQSDRRLGFYITYVDWLQSDLDKSQQLLVMWTNRAQNASILTICNNNESEKISSSIFGSSSSSPSGKSNAWKCDTLSTFSQRLPPQVNAKDTILASHNTNGTRLIFFALPRPDSVIGDHYHVAMLKGDERAPKYLTHGEFDLDRLVSYDSHADTLYFEVKISETAERHLYKLTSISSLQSASRQIKCLTCQLDEPCGYNYAHLNPGPKARFLVHECLGPSIPITRLRSIPPLAAGNISQGLQLEDKLVNLNVLNFNQHIENLVKNKQMPIEKFIAIKTNQQFPYDVHIKLYLPNEIEDEKDKRFPLLIESSEIDQRNVWKKFDLDWGKYLASRKQLIYAKIDCIKTKPMVGGSPIGSMNAGAAAGSGYNPRSSALTNDHDELPMDSSSPLFNAKDQIGVIKFLVENVDLFPYIDRRRIAIWGPTSTSAYVALATTINDDTKLIQCTVAVSPITNWRYMSSFKAEHYLGLPWFDSINSLRYERSNLLKRSYEFSMRKLLIIHGTADEQVNVQHSMQFLKSLTEHHLVGGVIHQMQLYPDVGHSLEQVKKHYYLTLDGFIDRCFYQKPITIKATEWKGKVRPKLY